MADALLTESGADLLLESGDELLLESALFAGHPAILGTARLNAFRLNYESAALARIRHARAWILINGVESRMHVRIEGLTIHDVLNDTPNTASLTVDTIAPLVGQTLRILLNSDAPQLLFNGTLDAVDLSYEGLPAQAVYRCTAVDDTARANRYLPFGSFTNVSASVVATALVTNFCPGMTANHVEALLPTVSIVLDGSEGMNGALAQMAHLIGGYFYWEDADLHFFLHEWANTPDPIDEAHPFLADPPIALHTDRSQLRTRVHGRGHGEALLTNVAATETILPIANAGAWFDASGGGAWVDDLRFPYTGVQAGGTGSRVGPGAAPGVALTAVPEVGTGLGTGVYKYGYTFVTASGESIASPLTTVTTGPIAAPASLPTIGAPIVGPGPDAGLHYYGVSFVASGETVATISTNNVTTYDIASPAAPTVSATPIMINDFLSGTYRFALVAVDAAGGTTTLGPSTGPLTIYTTGSGVTLDTWIPQIITPSLPDGASAFRIYGSRDGGATWHRSELTGVGPNVTTAPIKLNSNAEFDAQPGPPSSATALVHSVPLSTIPIGPPGTTARKLYRTPANAAYAYANFKLVATIANNTQTTYNDSWPDASLGAAAPASNTSALNQMRLTNIAIGPSGTTDRKVYRTAVGGSQLKLLAVIANNLVTGPITDVLADASLGANAPSTDTSGLSLTASGQILAGSTEILTSGSGPFAPAGGWARVGDQVIRYTGISGNTLTGIPSTSFGAIINTLTYGEHIDALPAITGVSGLAHAIRSDLIVNIWVQRDDLAAQAAQAAVDGAGDGVYEFLVSDERRNSHSLTQLCDAHLALYSRPIQTVAFATRDPKTKSGKTVTIDLAAPAIHTQLTIQDVTITEIDISPGLLPKFTASASSVRSTLDELLRRFDTAAKGAA